MLLKKIDDGHRGCFIIHHRPECDEGCRFKTILNWKKFKTDLLIFKCLQGTTVENFWSYGERVSYNYGTRGNKAALRVLRVRTEAVKSPSGSMAHLVSTNYQLIYEV